MGVCDGLRCVSGSSPWPALRNLGEESDFTSTIIMQAQDEDPRNQTSRLAEHSI